MPACILVGDILLMEGMETRCYLHTLTGHPVNMFARCGPWKEVWSVATGWNKVIRWSSGSLVEEEEGLTLF